MLKLVNPIHDNLSLAYRGNELDYTKIRDWYSVYEYCTSVFNDKNIMILNDISRNIKRLKLSNDITILDKQQLNYIIKNGAYNEEPYLLYDDKFNYVNKHGTTLLIKETIFTNKRDSNVIAFFAISQYTSLIAGYSPYFGMLLNDLSTIHELFE